MDYIQKLLLEYSRYINYRRLDSDEICLEEIDEFLTSYKPYDETGFGCSIPIRFKTREGFKTIEPGKKYDENLNEI